jgi:hypothetical protein
VDEPDGVPVLGGCAAAGVAVGAAQRAVVKVVVAGAVVGEVTGDPGAGGAMRVCLDIPAACAGDGTTWA